MSSVPAITDNSLEYTFLERTFSEPLDYTPSKIALIVTGALIVIGGLAASGLLLPSSGYSSFAYGGAGVVVGGSFIGYAVYSVHTAKVPHHVCVRFIPPKTESDSKEKAESGCFHWEISMLEPHYPLPLSIDQTNGTFAEMRERLTAKSDRPAPAKMSHLSLIESDKKYQAAKNEANRLLTSNSPIPFDLNAAMGVMMGMAVGDALGAPMEFLSYKSQGNEDGYELHGRKISMKPGEISGVKTIYDGYPDKFHLQPGQWTDDTAMGLCLADTLICYGKPQGAQMMWAYKDWWVYGYNNAFTKGPKLDSVGLGGNISQSFKEFAHPRSSNGVYATNAGDEFTSGNGSLMRNGPVGITNLPLQDVLDIARTQSMVTHRGEEARECCALMAYIIYKIISEDEKNTTPNYLRNQLPIYTWSWFVEKYSKCESVNALALGKKNVPSAKNKEKTENWNWKDQDFSFNEERTAAQPGYIGSYAMDALAMALHCVYTTTSFEEAVQKAVRYGGDADSVGAITGQIAGAIYGAAAIPKDWVDAVQQWDRGGEIAARALILAGWEPAAVEATPEFTDQEY